MCQSLTKNTYKFPVNNYYKSSQGDYALQQRYFPKFNNFDLIKIVQS